MQTIRHCIQNNGYNVLNELSENSKELQRSYKELTANYTNMKKHIETINWAKKKQRMQYKMKKTVDGIKSRLHEAKDQISELEDKVEKNSQTEQQNEKDLKRMKRV